MSQDWFSIFKSDFVEVEKYKYSTIKTKM